MRHHPMRLIKLKLNISRAGFHWKAVTKEVVQKTTSFEDIIPRHSFSGHLAYATYNMAPRL